jgi:hypothetical protein
MSYTEEPTVAGPAGRAWRTRLKPIGERGKPDTDGTVCCWLINAPGAHPFWSYWALSLIHLRPIEGTKQAHKAFETATHELMIMALDPSKPLPPLDVSADWPLHWLTPLDVCQQFEVPSDEAADEIATLCVRSIVDGRISPDQDYRSYWRVSIEATAEHYRTGGHVWPGASKGTHQ